MNIKNSLKDVLVLTIICIVFGAALAGVNMITAPIIAEMEAAATAGAYKEVMPDAAGFEPVDLSAYELPASVEEVVRETSGQGYAVKVVTSGYGSGLTIVVGVSPDGKVIRAVCSVSQETNGVEGAYGDNFEGKDLSGVNSVDLISGSTLTTKAYRNAVVDAINTATILGGGNVDIRDEAHILSDNLNAALGLEGAEFTKMFMVEIVSGAEKIYTENTGNGYVALIDGKFVGVDADGKAVKVVDAETVEVTEGVDAIKTSATDIIALVSATELTDLDLSTFTGIHKKVQSVQVTATGNYVIVIKADGHGVKGDPAHEHASGNPYTIKVSIGADGKIIDAQTVEHTETPTWGGNQLVDGAYNSQFIGKTQTEAGGVDTVAQSTNTTSGYKQAVLRAFEAYAIIVGGATNE